MEIIAEIGSVHDGSIGNALKLIEVSAKSGATVVKFQCHIPEAESTVDAPSPDYFKGESRFEYFKRIQFTESQWVQLRDHCHQNGVRFGCSVFSIESLELMLSVKVDILKVPSGEVSNLPLLRQIRDNCGTTPVHISSGMSSWAELDSALTILSRNNLSLFQCTSTYPAEPHHIGLNNIGEMLTRYRLPVGFSDHSRGIEMSIAAVALGATLVEKHITFSRDMYGSDAFNALQPDEFNQMCSGIKNVYNAQNNPFNKDDLREMKLVRKTFQKGVYAKTSLRSGELITMEKLSFLKPEQGIPASQIDLVLGSMVRRDIPAGSPIYHEDIN
jgi:N-acetylneuraminate synthase